MAAGGLVNSDQGLGRIISTNGAENVGPGLMLCFSCSKLTVRLSS